MMLYTYFLEYRKDAEPLYLFYVLTCITLLLGIYPVPAMHLLLVTPDVRNIDPDSKILISPIKGC